MSALGQNDVVRLLRSEVKRAGGQQEWARKYGVAPSMISMVLSGDRPPNKKIISALKLRRIVVFERVRWTGRRKAARRDDIASPFHWRTGYLRPSARSRGMSLPRKYRCINVRIVTFAPAMWQLLLSPGRSPQRTCDRELFFWPAHWQPYECFNAWPYNCSSRGTWRIRTRLWRARVYFPSPPPSRKGAARSGTRLGPRCLTGPPPDEAA